MISIQFDNSILISMIAINLTLIGLTSLAETKRVLGIDYGKFLVSKYYLFGSFIKLKYWLLVFLLINGGSTIGLFWSNYEVISLVIGISLSLCIVTLLLYFFFFILTINNGVKNQIYIDMLACMYTSINELNDGTKRLHSYFDSMLDIPEGMPTKRRIRTNVFRYFDEDSMDVEETFEEVFGHNSFLYNHKKHKRIINRFMINYNKSLINKKEKHKVPDAYIEKKYINNRYQYRVIDGNFDISHEFFQLFRQVELQDRWTIRMYKISMVSNSYNFISYSNIVRIMGNISLYGNTSGIRSYKFFQFITDEYINNVANKESLEYVVVNQKHVIKNNKVDFKSIEKVFIENLTELMFSGISFAKNNGTFKAIDEFKKSYIKILESNTFLSIDEKRDIYDYVKQKLNRTNLELSGLSEET